MAFPFELRFEVVQEIQALPLEFPNPAFVDLVDRNGVDEVKLLLPPPDRGD